MRQQQIRRSHHKSQATTLGKLSRRNERREIWTANKYLKEAVGDGGLPRIPPLKTTNENHQIITTEDNTSKAILLAKTFFPPPRANLQNDNHHQEEYPDPPTITKYSKN